MTDDRAPDPDSGVHWAILCLGGLALVLAGLVLLADAGALGSGSVAVLLHAGWVATLAEVLWTLSVLLAAFFAGLDGQWGWLIAILLLPFAQIAFAALPLYDAHFTRPEPLDYTSAGARAEADAEHSRVGREHLGR